MTFEEVKELLNLCKRLESRDHAFGDREIYWVMESEAEDVAEGYFGGGAAGVTLLVPEVIHFSGMQAKELARCGAIVEIGRNDSTGPDRYWGE